jgi:hypothetical protein
VKIYHQLNINHVALHNASGDFYPLQLVVQNQGAEIAVDSRLSEMLIFFTGSLEQYSGGNKDLALLIQSNFLRQKDLDYFSNPSSLPFYLLLEKEKSWMKQIISLYDIGNDGAIKNLPGLFKNYSSDICKTFDEEIKTQFLVRVQRVFSESIDNEEDRGMFNISNFLLHYINWENTFFNVYEASGDFIYGPLKNIESRFDDDFRKELKAYLAFRTMLNKIMRRFEDPGQCKIGQLSFLDWETEVKKYLTAEFESLFGLTRAVEYVNALDGILHRHLIRK